MRSTVALWTMFCLLTATPLLAQSANSSYKAGLRAESKNSYDVAFEAYKRAHEKKPADFRYMAAFLKARLYASSQHIQTGQNYRDVYKLGEAMAEFRRAVEIDPSNFAAQQEVRKTEELLRRKEIEAAMPAPAKAQLNYLAKAAVNAAGPVSLKALSSDSISLHLVTTADVIYRTVAKLAGINVLIDPDYKSQKVTLDLKDVSIPEALSMIALQTKTFWRPVSANTIMVTADNSGKRKDLEQNVMTTFYLHNVSTPAELQQAAATLKSILDIARIQITPEQRSLTIRATPDQLVLAQKLLRDIDKPRAEVMIDIAVLEVSRGRIQTLGINPPTTFTASLVPGGVATSASGSAPATNASSGFTLNSLAGINATNVQVTIPGASLTALMSDSNTKVLQKPQLRAMDSEKATLKIGDRIPVATGSYQSGLSNGVNTQFTYIDVGVNLDIVPYVHAGREVTLKMSFEISSVTGEQSVDGVTEPTIGQRRIEHQARLADGEVNLIGGILQDTESHSLSGYPFLAKIPLLKYLFAQENKEREQNEILFAITPHIIRANEVDEENERMVDVGAGSSVTYRRISAETPPPDTQVPALQPDPAKPAVAGSAAPIR